MSGLGGLMELLLALPLMGFLVWELRKTRREIKRDRREPPKS